VDCFLAGEVFVKLSNTVKDVCCVGIVEGNVRCLMGYQEYCEGIVMIFSKKIEDSFLFFLELFQNNK